MTECPCDRNDADGHSFLSSGATAMESCPSRPAAVIAAKYKRAIWGSACGWIRLLCLVMRAIAALRHRSVMVCRCQLRPSFLCRERVDPAYVDLVPSPSAPSIFSIRDDRPSSGTSVREMHPVDWPEPRHLASPIAAFLLGTKSPWTSSHSGKACSRRH
jgi:hypothetical protein